MRKRMLAALSGFLLLVWLCAACAMRGPAPARDLHADPVRIAVASDLHYLSPALTDNGPFFQRVTESGDGKLMLEIEAITEAFVGRMIDEAPDLLILSGDLTFNGAYRSHADLAEKLRRIEAAGVEVLVLPGNHDLNSSRAARFEGEGAELVRNTTAAEFRGLYRAFGYADALAFDKGSGSYVAEPCPGLRIILLDVNSVLVNSFPEQSLSWLERQLKEAADSGSRVITVSHQPVLTHNALFISGYRITNSLSLERLLAEYGVMANLSGHLHIQHLAQGSFPELLTEALPLYPCRFGMLLYDGDTLSYEALSLDVAARSEGQGPADDRLPDFDAFARESFYRHFYRQIAEDGDFASLPEEDRERLARCFAEVNVAYFSGAELDRDALSEELSFWTGTAGESFHTAYLRSILQDESPSPLKILLWQRESG